LINEDDDDIRKEFIQPFSASVIDKEVLRTMFNTFRSRNDVYLPLCINIKTHYNQLIPIGAVVLLQRNQGHKMILAKFYIAKIWRRGGYEERSLIEVISFVFNTQ
jgi:hypothetical protein